MGIPRVIQLRVLLNVLLDLVLGAVPLLGDLFDVAWKANARNLALVEHHAAPGSRVTMWDWLFVTALLGILLACAALPIVTALWLLQRMGLR